MRTKKKRVKVATSQNRTLRDPVTESLSDKYHFPFKCLKLPTAFHQIKIIFLLSN